MTAGAEPSSSKIAARAYPHVVPGLVDQNRDDRLGFKDPTLKPANIAFEERLGIDLVMAISFSLIAIQKSAPA